LAQNDDANLAVGWLSNVAEGSTLSSECDNKKLIGGHNVGGTTIYFEREIKLPANIPHNKVTLIFNLYALDSWDSEFYIIEANGVEVYKQ